MPPGEKSLTVKLFLYRWPSHSEEAFFIVADTVSVRLFRIAIDLKWKLKLPVPSDRSEA